MTQPDLIAGRYRVERALGRGGMGTVWLCHDEQLDRQVAIKQIDENSSIDGQAVDRARREARTIASIHHPNVVAIHDIIEDGAGLWLVMEYFPAPNLQELVADRGPLPIAEVAHTGAQIAAALAAAHGRGIIHRDVKPANVLVGDDGTAKLVDFGIARAGTDDQLTMQGMMSGTPVYFSPELARTGEPSFASDVWALGATMFAAVEGRAPYPSASTPVAMLHRIVAEEHLPLLRAGELAPVIAGMMTRDPQQRWSLHRVIAELRRIDPAGGATALFAGPPPAPGDVEETELLGGVTAAAVDDRARTQMLPRIDERPIADRQPMMRATGFAGMPPGTAPAAPPPQTRSGARAGWVVAAVLFALLAVGAGAWWLLDGMDPDTTDPVTPTTTVQQTTTQPPQTTTPAPTVVPTTNPPTTTAPPTTPPPTTQPPTTQPPTTQPPTTQPPTTQPEPPNPGGNAGNNPGNGGNAGNNGNNAGNNGNNAGNNGNNAGRTTPPR